MIRLWLDPDSVVSIREQLSAQLLLGILSRRLPPGERLPSVRELARRMSIHPNTVSAVYQDLTQRGWVESRHGSGVFVKPVRLPAEDGIQSFVGAWVEAARARGYSIEDLTRELARVKTPPRELIVVDPDIELARILAAEITEALDVPVKFRECKGDEIAFNSDVVVLVNAGQAQNVIPYIGTTPVHALQLKAMQEVVSGRVRPAGPVLIAVISRSESVLSWATPLLAALGFSPDAVVLRNASQAGWQDGLDACDIIASDICVSAEEISAGSRHTTFRIVAVESLAEVRSLVSEELTPQLKSSAQL